MCSAPQKFKIIHLKIFDNTDHLMLAELDLPPMLLARFH